MSVDLEEDLVTIYATNKCNLSCIYCRGAKLKEKRMESEISSDTLRNIMAAARQEGYSRIKFSSEWGEPLIRSDLENLIANAKRLRFRDISLSTNGTMLANRVESLRKAGLHRLCVSLDTLDRPSYEKITGQDLQDDVVGGIEAASNVFNGALKVNMVVLAGVNDSEIDAMLRWTFGRRITLQLIELVGDPPSLMDRYHLDLAPVIRRLSKEASLIAQNKLDKRTTLITRKGRIEIRQSKRWPDQYHSKERMLIHPDGEIGFWLNRHTERKATAKSVKRLREEIREAGLLGVNPTEVKVMADFGCISMVS